MNETRTLSGHIRTFLIVTLITVMVWLLAESKMVRTRTVEPQVVLLTVDTDGGAQFVVRHVSRGSAGETGTRTVSVEIKGSTAGLDRFVRLMQSRIELRVGQEIPAQPGIHTLDLLTILREASPKSLHGVIITEVSPDSIAVEVDELVTRELDVRVDMPEGVELDSAPRTDPTTVRVVGPSSVLAKVQANEVVVRVDPLKLARLAQGRRETIPDVVVDLAGVDLGGWATQIEPGQVDVFVTLRTLIETHTIDRLPIQVLIAPAEVGDWKVEIDDANRDIVNVIIEGPANAIEQLIAGEAIPRAFVQLTFEDLERQVSSKPVQILGLPPGCRVVSPEQTVNLSIRSDTPSAQDQPEPGVNTGE
ncbi:MAG: hypothetical protein JKX70_12285 [Phycisphaerales bacterium]|nr:hypothetical protein [Phycisphaerales bacterium]